MGKHSEYNGKATNNHAEYRAMELALLWCKNNIANAADIEIRLYSDSELVVKQLNGKYKVRSEALKELNRKVARLVKEFKSVSFTNVRRENKGVSTVDKALNELLDDIEAKPTHP